MYFFLNSLGETGDYKKGFIVISTIIMIFISGLRHEYVGNDTLVTMLKFEANVNTPWKYIFQDFWTMYMNPSNEQGKDPGEIVFNKLLSYFTTDSRTFLFVIATIVLCSLGRFIYRNSKTLHSVLFSYIFFVSLFYHYIPNSAMRQTLAVAILFYAYSFLMQKQHIKFILLLLAASTLHKSVLIAGIMLPLVYIKNVRFIYYGCIPLFIFMFVFYNEAASLLGIASEVYENYTGADYYASMGRSRPIMVILMVLGLYIYNIIILERDPNRQDNRIYYIGIALSLVFTPLIQFDPSAIRIVAYFGMFIPIISGNLSNNTIITRNGFIFIIAIFILRAASASDDGYRFMWQEKEYTKYKSSLLAPPLKNGESPELAITNSDNILFETSKS